MSYKIAVASTDGKSIDVSFGGAAGFLIYEVGEDKQYHFIETREWKEPEGQSEVCQEQAGGCGGQQPSCGQGGGCGSGGGCGGGGAEIPKLSLVKDCRCVLCRKIGFQVRKQLEKKAITAFDIEYDITGALDKIVAYFDRVDNHQTLRGIAHDNG